MPVSRRRRPRLADRLRRAVPIATATCGARCSMPASSWPAMAVPMRSCCARRRAAPASCRTPPIGTSRVAMRCWPRSGPPRSRRSRVAMEAEIGVAEARARTPVEGPGRDCAPSAPATCDSRGRRPGCSAPPSARAGRRGPAAAPRSSPATAPVDSGLDPFELLGSALDRLADAGLLAPERRPRPSISPGLRSTGWRCW